MIHSFYRLYLDVLLLEKQCVVGFYMVSLIKSFNTHTFFKINRIEFKIILINSWWNLIFYFRTFIC